MVHFYRNVFTAVPSGMVREVAAILKAIHAQEYKTAADQKARAVVAKLREMKLARAAALVEEGVEETLSLRLPPGTLAVPQDQQSHGAAQPGGAAPYPRGGRLGETTKRRHPQSELPVHLAGGGVACFLASR